jgi:hypothetical protein
VVTIGQRLRNDHRAEVSPSTVRRYITITFAEQRTEDKVSGLVRSSIVEAGLA